MNLKDLKQEKIKSNKTNKTKDKICEVGNNIKFVADNKDTCSYKTLTKEELNKNYKAIYGSNIKEYNNFAISNTETCYLDEEIYYCGEGETYTYALSGEATIYRLIDKAIKQLNGDVTIYDYFLKISDNKCYTSNNNLENSDCTKALKKQKEIVPENQEELKVQKNNAQITASRLSFDEVCPKVDVDEEKVIASMSAKTNDKELNKKKNTDTYGDGDPDGDDMSL